MELYVHTYMFDSNMLRKNLWRKNTINYLFNVYSFFFFILVLKLNDEKELL